MSISTVTSEALQLKLRQLLPSQQGFGTDLSASDTIIPIVDLTRAAEGSDTPQFLQTAWDFSTNLTTQSGAGSSTAVTTTGFYKVDLTCVFNTGHASPPKVEITDGVTSSVVWTGTSLGSGSGVVTTDGAEFYIFLKAGDSCVITCFTSQKMNCWTRQVADVNGNLTDPAGFVPQ